MKLSNKQMSYVLIDPELYDYSDYLDYCKDMDKKPQSEFSEDYENWFYDQINEDNNSFRYSISNCEYSDQMCYVEGYMGLWSGKRHVGQFFDSLEDAIEKVCYSITYDHTLRVVVQGGVINVEISHHDGGNYYTIHLLNKRGVKCYQSAINKDKDPKPTDYWFQKIDPEKLSV